MVVTAVLAQTKKWRVGDGELGVGSVGGEVMVRV